MKFYSKNYRMEKESLEHYYSYLVEKTRKHQFIGITNEWIVDNYYMIIEREKGIKEFLDDKKSYQAAFFGVNLYEIVRKNLAQHHFRLDFGELIKAFVQYQEKHHCHFSYFEISTIANVCYLVVIDELYRLTCREKERQALQEKAERIIREIQNERHRHEHFSLEKYLSKEILKEPSFLEHFYSVIKENGQQDFDILEKVTTMLHRHHIDLSLTLEKYYEETARDTVLVSNLFYSIQQISKMKCERLFSGISATEKVLLQDAIYPNMTTETKELYRNELQKKAKRKGLSEYDYVRQIQQQAKKDHKHIGFYLLCKENPRRNYFFYLFSITFFTVIIAAVLAPFLFQPSWISFFFLLIPISEIVIQIVNRLLLHFYHPKPLPKLDFNEGIPEEYPSMVVITTILKTPEKVEEMFRTLETYYLSNASDNLYFTLLGDAASYREEVAPQDSEIVKVGKQIAKNLNKKYGKDIFYFVYRKRKYSKSEQTYLGWERKRGALQDFNCLLLHHLTPEEIERFFWIETIPSDMKIKYVIALDTDTKLVLGTAFKMIGAMAHPLNQPVFNEKRDRVIAGYGIMQPKMTLDIAKANQSIYSQIFAGLGGFDVYSSVIPDLYQDVFGEGNFTGKGIYDLAVFDEILTNKFPTDLILSHDLLEGSFVRCGYLSDTELWDDFPADFIVDVTRQHRWARGDMQIASWIFRKSSLNAMHRFKIWDNIRRGLLPLSLLVILFITYTISPIMPYYWVSFICFVLLLPILFFIGERLRIQKERSTKTKQYQNIFIGFQAATIRMIAAFSSIPYHTFMYLDAFFRSLYRMIVSKKNLLNWITAEEAEKRAKKDFYHYLLEFKGNYIVSIFLVIAILIFNPANIISALVISLIFLISPLLYYLMGKTMGTEPSKLSKKERAELHHLARLTWHYFEDYLTQDNHFLIPDNYQTNREQKVDVKTSPTNIGFSLTSVICANELGFIPTKKAIFYLHKIIETVESLDKWKGHLYNWYHIKTLKVMFPYHVSTVDSGNFVASLMVTKQFLIKYREKSLAERIERLIQETDFTKLYHSSEEVFSVGYDPLEEQLSVYNYNKFASESRLGSFVAIAKGDIPSKHWFCLDKTLTKFHQYKGLLSWSGTSFEYFMPYLYMHDYPNTLIDESYHFAYFCQKEYGKEIDPHLPFGISEAAYNVLDDSKNYQYQAFGTPYLKFQVHNVDRLVIAPYASLLILPKKPEEVYHNYLKFKKLGMVGDYGCFDAYDAEDKQPVYAYFAHHQGMILGSITNYFCHHILQEYFHSDVRVEAFDILNKEKMQIKPMIDSKISKFKTYDYNKETIENDVRIYHEPQAWPEISVLSNSKYTLLINDRGNSFSRYNNIQLNRYRKVTEQDYGIYVYIRDLASDKVWSNTYAPTNKEPDRYEVTFALDMAKFSRVDDDLQTTTEIIVTKEHNAEIRKVTIKNLSDEVRNLEITTYTEPIVAFNNDDISHRVFNSMFLKSCYDKELSALFFSRKVRNSNDFYYLLHQLWIPKNHNEYSFETERNHFINRNDSYQKPAGLFRKLSNYTGDNLDPIASIRNEIKVKPLSSLSFYVITGFGTSLEQVKNIAREYHNENEIEESFNMATVMTNKMMKKVGIDSRDATLYNKALNYLYQTTSIHLSLERRHYLLENTLSQKNLWRFGISGDLPIILVEIEEISSLGLLREILKMFEYYKNRGIFTDVVIINSHDPEQAATILDVIQKELYYIYSIQNMPSSLGNITVIEDKEITFEERNLFRGIARLKFNTVDIKSLKDYIENMQIHNHALERKKIRDQKQERLAAPSLEIDNGYGGFLKEGKEYCITTPNTPMPWVNILANRQFGAIVTNNNNGFTFAYNSKEYKITGWTNDTLLNDPSEGFVIQNKNIRWQQCIHGFGYSTFQSKDSELNYTYTTFVPQNEKVKLGLLTLENRLSEEVILKITYWINPVLGENEDKTIRHIVDTYDEKNNLLTLQNRYTSQYKEAIVYMSSTEKIDNITNEPLKKAITIQRKIGPSEKITIGFYLGCEDSIENILKSRDLYRTVKQINDGFHETKDFWKQELSTIQVSSPDREFNYMMNGWYLYQTIASRILAKSGFYQVGGAFGFRDQLQDCMNIALIKPEMTRYQILNCASHQFKEGDVLHWWHENSHFGLRSRFKDDYLWLVYATQEYLEITEDASILREPVPFVEGFSLLPEEEERGMEFIYSVEKVPLSEHLQITIEKAMRELGDNGLPFMGGGDWNDGMNHIGIKGKGTSVWLGFFLYDVIQKYIQILTKYQPTKSVKVYESFLKKLKQSLQKEAWDGEYFLRAFHDSGAKIGSKTSREGKIDLISQSFAILTDIATSKQTESILCSVEKALVDQKAGLIRLLTPPFSGNWLDVGYIANYAKGIRENGGQYTHACAWFIMALEHLGYGDQAYDYYRMLNPICHADTKEKAETYQVEPYVIPADIYTHPRFYGKGGWTWYTGSSGWFYKVGITSILGISKKGNYLMIDPKIPHKWDHCEIDYRYQNTKYHISIRWGETDMIQCDGKSVEKIFLENDHKLHEIIVVKGK